MQIHNADICTPQRPGNSQGDTARKLRHKGHNSVTHLFGPRRMPDIFDNISAWLLEQALVEDPLETTIKGLAARLLDGGLPIARISVGRTVLHPTIGLIDMQWSRDTGRVDMQSVPRSVIDQEFLTGSGPFTDLNNRTTQRIVANLADPNDVARYKIFEKLAAEGLTGYVALGCTFGTQDIASFDRKFNLRGAAFSFATNRFSGFSDADIEGLERLIPALSVCIRVDTDRFMATEVLGAYLGEKRQKQF